MKSGFIVKWDNDGEKKYGFVLDLIKDYFDMDGEQASINVFVVANLKDGAISTVIIEDACIITNNEADLVNSGNIPWCFNEVNLKMEP